MPVFVEHSGSTRDLSVLPTFAQPLPKHSPRTAHKPQEERYEVVIVGAGPAGLFLNLLLARYGLKDEDLLCVDAKPASVKSGQADGISYRTLEILKSLDLVDEVLNYGKHNSENCIWRSKSFDSPDEGIERTELLATRRKEARYDAMVTLHQGRIERILIEDLEKYSKRGVQWSTRFMELRIDEDGDAEFPVVAEIEHEGIVRTVRTKHLVGADGAHSLVRRKMGMTMEGEATDDIWGVIDFVADTDFPDVRKLSHIHTPGGSILQIPRERKYTGDWLTRIYVRMKEVKAGQSMDDLQEELSKLSSENRQDAERQLSARRSQVTAEAIFEKAAQIYKPYRMMQKEGTEVEWWAAYQVGQRLANRFVQKDSKGVPRVFIVGDACHTHSPKVGQGMNVSMADSYDLSWKLAHSLLGLSADPLSLLDTYEIDRRENALNLIEFDKRWYAMRWAKPGSGAPPLDLRSEIMMFFSGIGVEYDEGLLVERQGQGQPGPIHSTDYTAGALREGRRIKDVETIRFADGNLYHLQDDLPSNGRFRILALTSSDLLGESGVSSSTVVALCTKVIPQYPREVLELVIVHPLDNHSFEWTDIPACVKRDAEMRFHHADSTIYATYGVNVKEGAMAIIRPDGVVGTIAHLNDVGRVDAYLERCLKKINTNGA